MSDVDKRPIEILSDDGDSEFENDTDSHSSQSDNDSDYMENIHDAEENSSQEATALEKVKNLQNLNADGSRMFFPKTSRRYLKFSIYRAINEITESGSWQFFCQCGSIKATTIIQKKQGVRSKRWKISTTYKRSVGRIR